MGPGGAFFMLRSKPNNLNPDVLQTPAQVLSSSKSFQSQVYAVCLHGPPSRSSKREAGTSYTLKANDDIDATKQARIV